MLAYTDSCTNAVEKTKYRLWLKLRIGKSLDTEDDALTVSIAGRTVTIESENRGEPLSKTSWLVMSCRGFKTEAQAREFGEELRRATHLAGLCNRLGVDAGDPSEDRTMSWLNPEIVRNVNPDIRLAPDVHGIVILPDDGNNVFARWRVNAQVRANTGHFARSLEECLPGNEPLRSCSPSIRRAIRVLSLAEINEDPIAKLVLAVSTIEGLAKDPPWLERADGDREEAQQVVKAVRQVWKGSIRQRIRKLLKANDLSCVRKDWDRLYKRRSGFFHDRSEEGSEHLGNHLEQSSLHALGQEAIKLCARIVLTMAQREGVAVPGRAKVHFGVD